jgi:hypothetical protein
MGIIKTMSFNKLNFKELTMINQILNESEITTEGD